MLFQVLILFLLQFQYYFHQLENNLYKYHQITSKNFEKDAPLIGSDVIIFKDKYPKIIDGLSQYKYLKAKKYYWRKVYLIFPSQKNLTKKIYNHFKNHNMGAKKQPISQNNLISSSMLLNKEFKELLPIGVRL